MSMHFLITFMFFMGLFSFEMNRKHMLMMLLSLEFIILSLMYLMCMMCKFKKWVFFLMLFLFFSVCESVLGLSLLVSLIHSHESDYFDSLNLLWQNFYLVYHL